MSTKQPKVSVMIPVYNAKDFVEECLDSILSQDYQNLELVVSDDCSIDGTQDILKNYVDDKRVKLLLNKKNLGVTDNCNQALLLCSGEYVCFFAGDDIMLPNKITAQVSLLTKHPEASMCYHAVTVFDSENGETLYETEKGGRTIYSFFDMIEKGGLPGINSVMARRNCLPPGLYDSNFPVVSDWLFMIEVALRGKIIFIDEIYTKYRKHKGGITNEIDIFLHETLDTLRYIEDRFQGNLNIISSCHKSRTRYLLGALFRGLITRNNMLVIELIKLFVENKNYVISTSTYVYMKTLFRISRLNYNICIFIRKVYGR